VKITDSGEETTSFSSSKT